MSRLLDTIKQLAFYPEFDNELRALPDEYRFHITYNINQFFKPNWTHIDLEHRISVAIRSGYLGRNPTQTRYWQEIEDRIKENPEPRIRNRLRSKATGFYIVGLSGTGKTEAVEQVLDLYPQVIEHGCYNDHPFPFRQVVWLKLECPFDGSVKGLCLSFFETLDELLETKYYENYAKEGSATVDQMLIAMKRLSLIHGIGCLAVDEIQNLSVIKSAGVTKMLAFFVQLVNMVGTPVILIGTYKALPLLQREFRQARRASGQGDLIWPRMEQDQIWEQFLKVLWRYQYVRNPIDLTAQLSDALYEMSQGIVDFAVKMFVLAQWRAIVQGSETITENIIRSVGVDSFRFSDGILEAMREGNWEKLKMVEDVVLIDMDFHYRKLLEKIREKIRSSISLSECDQELLEGLSQSGRPSATTKISADRKKTAKNRTKRRKKPSEEVFYVEGDLRQVIKDGKAEEDITTYEALRRAGYVQPVTEFLV
jgi:hypothetical protein